MSDPQASFDAASDRTAQAHADDLTRLNPGATVPRPVADPSEWLAAEGPEPSPRGAPRRYKVRATFYLPVSLLEEARDAAVHLSGPPLHLTLGSLAEAALRRELERLKTAHNGGEGFPRRQRGPKGGRPIGVRVPVGEVPAAWP